VKTPQFRNFQAESTGFLLQSISLPALFLITGSPCAVVLIIRSPK
jgi:hypothetical protein